MTKEEILKAFEFRHACKEFDPEKKISESDFEFLLETARLSPSSFGIEPWEYLIIQNPELREELRAYTWGGQKQLPTCSHLLVCLAKKAHFMKHDSDYVYRYMKEIQKNPDDLLEKRRQIFKKFQESDFDLLESERTLFDWSCKQTYIAMGNMMTAAAMIGIDSCPIEGFQKKEVEDVLVKSCGIDLSTHGISYMIAFGYRVLPLRPKTRQPAEEIIRWVS